MRKFFIIFSLLALCSCDHYEEDRDAAKAQINADSQLIQENSEKNTMRVANNVRDSIKRTGEHMRKWWLTPLPPEPEPNPVPIRYCYRVLQDILCYRDQMPGWENKLVGYQGQGAAPPIPATTKVIPLRADNPAALPETRAANAKPVITGILMENKETKDKNSSQPQTIDTTHENLPDTPLSPQL